MRELVQKALTLVSLAAATAAVTPMSDADMARLLNAGGVELAMRAQPMFLTGQAVGKAPCIPSWATVNGTQAAPSKLCAWPDSGCDCRNPGVPLGSPLPSFPVYFSYTRCGDAAVRVAYNLFYTKDGFIPNKIFGHPFDWERVIVIWDKNQSNGTWAPAQLYLSQHTGYQRIEWAHIKNTFDAADAGKPRGGPDGLRNLDHPKCYIASAKHDMHQEKSTTWVDVLSQLTDNAFRSDSWWYFPTKGESRSLRSVLGGGRADFSKGNYILADESTDVGKLIASFDWGDADSTPPLVAKGLCNA
ncbi:Necrosis inducing [Metarhizium album ARSEF 1941]|uniref:Necrosis inducing n=1 Tax=Metarhizium album (strain ARSEF 1941) TaxID=1081103 RepID=A0A0B2WJ91_METAS|nr:Necrosis inducing [Metarhizium album ARSEF 1941]KHN93973.1 Necrosis inducing [Metarhizium album ARSEF 1941]